MTTVRLNNTVFMHVPKTGGTTITLAFGKAGMVRYDYRYHVSDPAAKNYTYGKEMMLFDESGEAINATRQPAYGPHARLWELRSEDQGLPKITVIRNPHDWYRSYWSHHVKYHWTTEVSPPYLANGGSTDFNIWLQNMINDSKESGIGYYSRYTASWIDNQTHIVRLEYLIDDMQKVLKTLNESQACMEYMERRENTNRNANSLVITPDMVEEIKRLDAGLILNYQ